MTTPPQPAALNVSAELFGKVLRWLARQHGGDDTSIRRMGVSLGKVEEIYRAMPRVESKT